MQRLLVICTLGIGLSLAQGCATQDLPFSTAPQPGAAHQATPTAATTATPYRPQSGLVYDGKSGAAAPFGQGAPAAATGYSTPPPRGYATPPPTLPNEPYRASDYGNAGGQPAPASGNARKPVTTSPTGLKEREL